MKEPRDDLERHLPGLLGAAGKSIALAPNAKERIDALRRVGDRDAFLRFLEREEVDLGLDARATGTILNAARDESRWRDAHAALLRSAEQQLVDRFSSSA